MENVLLNKSYNYALKIVIATKDIKSNNMHYVLFRQLLRSGTSVGANIEEANKAQSKKDFLHKLAIAQKELYETEYWLRLLKDSNLMDIDSNNIMNDTIELKKIIASSIITLKKRLSENIK
jgi:four helix bundle protein